jgi:NAD(P)-dependent dehydrogenase (short-subunit alcohol dehydrogenase family)
MDLGLAHKVVLITGGSKGIGLACAAGFAAEGARVAIASRERANLDAALASLAAAGHHGVVAVQADLRQAEAADAMVAEVERRLGPLDILVNSAGAAQRTPPEELTAAHWHAAMDAKFFTYVHAMQAVLAGMTARGAGVILNVVGTGGKIASPVHLPGGAANAALMLASAGLANALAGKGVRVNVVNPGLVATTRLHEGLAAQSRLSGQSVEALLALATRNAPLGRLALAEDIANVVVFLASRQAAYVSGSVLTVDGANTPMVV